MQEVLEAGKIIERARNFRGWRQVDLAAETGVGLSTIARLEQGKGQMPTARIMNKLARVLDLQYIPSERRFALGVFIEVSGATARGLSRMATRENKTIEQLLADFVGGSIDENYKEFTPTEPGDGPVSGTHRHGTAAKSATGH